MTMAFDTLKAMKRLTATGVEEAQAEAIIETVGGAMTESLATKDDLALLKADLTAESAAGTAELDAGIAGAESRLETKIESLRGDIAGAAAEARAGIAEVRGEIAGTESRLETKIESLRGETAAGIAEVRTEIAERYTKIAEGQTTQLRWMIGCMIAIAGVLVSTLVLVA